MKVVLSIIVAGLTLLAATPGFAENITVGFIGPTSGKVAASGIGGRNSAELAVNLRNSSENSKYKYELISLDDECKPNIGVQVATKMAANRHVVGAVTHFCSAVATGTVDIYHKFNLPVVVWGAIAPGITNDNDYGEIFRTIGTLTSQNDAAVKFMEEQGYKKVVMIHDTTAYGVGHRDAFVDFAKGTSVNVLKTIGVPADQQDFTAELTSAKSLGAEVIYFGGLSDLAIRVRNQMDRVGLDAQFIGVSGVISDTFIEGAVNAEGSIAMQQGASIDQMLGGKEFLKHYADAGYDDPPEAFGIYAFSAMNVLLDAIEASGPKRKDIAAGLAALPQKDYAIGPVLFNEKGQNTFTLVTPLIVKDGAWVEFGKKAE